MIAFSAQLEPDLREWDYGAYEGRTSAQIQETVPDWTIWTSPVPQGETIQQVAARASRVIERAVKAGGDVALFAHGHVLRILTACWLGLPPDAGRFFALSTASARSSSHDGAGPCGRRHSPPGKPIARSIAFAGMGFGASSLDWNATMSIISALSRRSWSGLTRIRSNSGEFVVIIAIMRVRRWHLQDLTGGKSARRKQPGTASRSALRRCAR